MDFGLWFNIVLKIIEQLPVKCRCKPLNFQFQDPRTVSSPVVSVSKNKYMMIHISGICV